MAVSLAALTGCAGLSQGLRTVEVANAAMDCDSQRKEERLLALLDESKGQPPPNPPQELALTLLAMHRVKQGRLDDAEAYMRQLLALREATPNASPASIAEALDLFVPLYAQQQHFDKAEEYLLRAQKLRVDGLGADDQRSLDGMNRTGNYYLERQNLNEAARYYEDSRGRSKGNVRDALIHAFALRGLAEVASANGRRLEAEKHFRSALEAWALAQAPEPTKLVILEGYAKLLDSLGRANDAAPLVAEASAIRRRMEEARMQREAEGKCIP